MPVAVKLTSSFSPRAPQSRIVSLASNSVLTTNLPKPFAIEELVARVHALVRRGYDTKRSVITIGSLEVDTAAKRVTLDSEDLKVPPRDYALLEYLAMRKGRIVSREEIEDHVYYHAKEVRSNAVDSAVCLLRKRLHQGDHQFLKTVHRQGYVLEEH